MADGRDLRSTIAWADQLAWLKELKGPRRVVVQAVQEYSWMSTESKYQSICSATGGQYYPEWPWSSGTEEPWKLAPEVMADLASASVTTEQHFELTHEPVLWTIEVHVNGVLSTEWAWREETDGLVFAEDATVEPGATVEITYRALSDCGSAPD